jgi:hypothetical protein
MGKTITPDQRAWVSRINQAMGNSKSSAAPSAPAKPGSPDAWSAPSPDGTAAPWQPGQPVPLGFPPRNGDPLGGYRISPELVKEMMEKEKKDREKREKDAQAACAEARKWLKAHPMEELLKLSYPAIVTKIKEKFPLVNDLPKPKMLMDMVDKVLEENGYLLNKGVMGDPKKLAMEKVIAAYIAALPKNIKATVTDGGIRLVTTGAADADAEGSAKAGDKKGEKFEFKNKNYTIEITNAAWKALDPALRAKWKGLNDEATALEELMAKLKSLKKEWETKNADGTSSKVELEARIKDLEAEFKGRWETLQKDIDATAKLTTDGLKASITEAKKKSKDEKAGAELELKFEEMSASLKAFATTKDLKTALSITGSAEKIAAKIEAEAIKTGTVVTLAYEKALKEVKEQLELQVKQGKTTVAATLSKKAEKLDEKLKDVKDGKTKDFAAVDGLEKDLAKLQFEVKAEFEVGNFKIAAGGKVVEGGEAGGKVKVEMMLEKGIQFFGDGQKISFSADVTNKGYAFALMFSVGEMPKIDDVQKANKEADEKIRKMYDLVKDTKIRSMDDAKKIQEALSEVIKPLKKSVEAMKKVDKKQFAFEFGITVTGEFNDGGGKMPPPVTGLGFKIVF